MMFQNNWFANNAYGDFMLEDLENSPIALRSAQPRSASQGVAGP
jgi:hypothetical protein